MVTTVFLGFTDEREVKVHDPHLDIVLVFDESGTMAQTDYPRIYQGFREWVTSYYKDDKVAETRFAVIGCNNAKAQLYFDESERATEVGQKIPHTVPENAWNNFDNCFKEVASEIFTDARGDRPNASNVVLCKCIW